MPGIGGGHEVEKPVGHSDAGAGPDFHLAGPGMSKSLVQHINAFFHGQQLSYFAFRQKQGHEFLLSQGKVPPQYSTRPAASKS
jgi:hypothetical protein